MQLPFTLQFWLEDRSSDVVYELLVESDIVYENVDVVELSRYLAVTVDPMTISQHGLSEFVMTRK